MARLLSGNAIINNAPISFSSMRGVSGTHPLPWSNIQPACVILVDSLTSPTDFSRVDSDNAVVDTLSLMQIAEAVQEVVQLCVVGGP